MAESTPSHSTREGQSGAAATDLGAVITGALPCWVQGEFDALTLHLSRLCPTTGQMGRVFDPTVQRVLDRLAVLGRLLYGPR